MVWQIVALINDKMPFSKQIIKALVLILSVTSLVACQKQPPTALSVQLLWQGQPLACGQPLPLADASWQLEQLQFYVSDFQHNGQPLLLVENDWQSTQVSLLGTDCQSPGQWQILLQQPLPSGELRFTLGLPSTLNHQNPLTAQSPLQQSDMHWSWQNGYKFFRLDLQGAAGGWSMHLGSTGCRSASVMRAPSAPCLAPNRPQVALQYQQGDKLTLDLAPLFAVLTPSADNSCMSDPNQHSCQQLLPVFGLGGAQQLWQSAR